MYFYFCFFFLLNIFISLLFYPVLCWSLLSPSLPPTLPSDLTNHVSLPNTERGAGQILRFVEHIGVFTHAWRLYFKYHCRVSYRPYFRVSFPVSKLLKLSHTDLTIKFDKLSRDSAIPRASSQYI